MLRIKLAVTWNRRRSDITNTKRHLLRIGHQRSNTTELSHVVGHSECSWIECRYDPAAISLSSVYSASCPAHNYGLPMNTSTNSERHFTGQISCGSPAIDNILLPDIPRNHITFDISAKQPHSHLIFDSVRKGNARNIVMMALIKNNLVVVISRRYSLIPRN